MKVETQIRIIVSAAERFRDAFDNDAFADKGWDLQDYIQEAIDTALQEIVPAEVQCEREACATVAESYLNAREYEDTRCAADIAKDIRARGKESQ